MSARGAGQAIRDASRGRENAEGRQFGIQHVRWTRVAQASAES